MGMFRALIAALAGTLVVPSSAAALELEPIDGFDYDSPVYVTSEPADPNRLYVVEQDGRIRLSVGGVSSEILDISDLVRSPEDAGGGNEQGLLSMAFSPDHATTGLFYVFYTAQEDQAGALRIAEFDADGEPVEGTRREVAEIPHVGDAQNHNGGQLQFGPDGHLYASTGDGGTGGANAQNLTSLLGKIMRISPAGSGPGDYSVPPDNPFAGPVAGEDEIWSYGLRNPWRFSFDRTTGALTIADVGQGSWEEVDFEPQSAGRGKGDNFGWRCREGMHQFSTAPPCDTLPLEGFTEPVFEYANGDSTCAVTGGYVVRDQALGDLYGRYMYADLCAGDVRSLCPAVPAASNDRSEGIAVSTPTSFGEDSSGRVYVVERGGAVSRFTGPASPGACPSPTSPPPGSGADSGDSSPPRLILDAKSPQRLNRARRVRVLATVEEPAEVVLDAVVRRRGRRSFDLEEESVQLDAGVTERVKWRLSGGEARKVRRHLRKGRKAKARVNGHAVDAAGNVGERRKVKIRLVR